MYWLIKVKTKTKVKFDPSNLHKVYSVVGRLLWGTPQNGANNKWVKFI